MASYGHSCGGDSWDETLRVQPLTHPYLQARASDPHPGQLLFVRGDVGEDFIRHETSPAVGEG